MTQHGYRSQQLNAQIELPDFIASFYGILKQKSLEQRNSVSDMIDKVTELLQDYLDRQTVEFRQHIRWLKGVRQRSTQQDKLGTIQVMMFTKM